MPNLTQKAYTQNMSMSYNDGRRDGERAGVIKATEEHTYQRRQEIVNILREASLLAQANAKLTYSLHMLIEKATKNA